MKLKGIDKALEYSKGKSSSPVFAENHKIDFLNGYNLAVEDVKAIEMFNLLKELRKSVDFGYSSWGNDKGLILSEKIDELVKSLEG